MTECELIIPVSELEQKTLDEWFEKVRQQRKTNAAVEEKKDMPYEEAFKWVEGRLASGKTYDEAYQAAIEALEKQIPKKVKNLERAVDKYGDCPLCGTSYQLMIDETIDYCHNCGQRLDWS